MIIGIGTDIVEISRIQKVLTKKGITFAKRILVAEELEAFSQHKKPEYFLAKRFAAKEAIAKAFGLGIGKISFLNIEIKKGLSGEPKVHLTGYAHELKEQKKITSVHLSISDEIHSAIAFAVLEAK